MIAILLLGTFSTSYSQSMMNIALPHVADAFHITLSQANWMVVGYTIVAATTITLAAALQSRMGLKRVFYVSGIALLGGSVIGLFAPEFFTLLIARLVQAVSTGILFPLVTGAIMTVTAPNRRGVILATNSAIIGVGLAIGPLISGLLLTYFNLHIMFLVPAVLSIALIIGTKLFMHNVGDRRRLSIDPLSLLLSFVGLGTLSYGLSEITHDPLPATIGLVIGLVVIALFVWRQLRLKTPLLDLRPLRKPGFTFGIVLIMLGMMNSASLSLLLPLYFEGTAGYSAFGAGLLLLAPTGIYAFLDLFGGRLFDKHGIWPMVPAGYGLITIGLIGVLLVSQTHSVLAVVAISVVAFSGISFIIAPCKSTALGQLQKDEYPDGSAINSTFVQIAESIGSALFVGVLSADVIRMTAHGISRPDAYASGFSHTILIALIISAVGLIIAFFYARRMAHKAANTKK